MNPLFFDVIRKTPSLKWQSSDKHVIVGDLYPIVHFVFMDIIDLVKKTNDNI